MNPESSSATKRPEAFADLIKKGLRPGISKEIERGFKRGLDRVLKEAFKEFWPAQIKSGAQTKAAPNEVEVVAGDIIEALWGNPAPGDWRHETMVMQGDTVQRVRAGDHDVTGLGMRAEDAAFIAAVNPQAIGTLLLDWQTLRTSAEQASQARDQAMTSGLVLEKLHRGDALDNEELSAMVKHFRALNPLLAALGPTWALAGKAALHESQRAEDMARSRGLVVGD